MILQTPRISVVMPVHNGETYLAEAVESILRQSLTDLEFIVVNDGSTDGTDRILDSFRTNDSRMVALRPGKVGFAAALNLGIDAARSEYIGRMDADDIALPDRLRRQIEFLDANADISACGTATEAFREGTGQRVSWPGTPAMIRANLLFSCPLCHPSVVLRKTDLARHGVVYRHEYGGCADYDLWCQMDRHGLRLANLPEVLLRYRFHANQITSSDSSRQIGLADRIRVEQLGHYGVKLEPGEIEIHSRLSRWVQFYSRAELAAAGAWLTKLEQAIGELDPFPHKEFHDELADHWYYACATSSDVKWDLVSLFRQRRFGSGPLRSLKLLGKSLLRWLRGPGQRSLTS